jgi:hypothetical protein
MNAMNRKTSILVKSGFFKRGQIARSSFGLFMAFLMASPSLLVSQIGRADVVPLPPGVAPTGGVSLPAIPGMPRMEGIGDPTIKLPALPPLKPGPGTMPGLPGGFPTPPIVAPPTMPGGIGGTIIPGHPVMPGIDRSAFPGMSCALVDNRPHKDILQALQNLTRVVVITPECQNNADMAKISDDLKKMVTSAQGLSGVWNNPQSVAQDPAKTVDFQNSIGTMVMGINRITDTLQNNSFLNSKCGSQMLSGSGMITAVSDLVATFAPFALIGASMAPSLGVTLPWILGITGVGSVAKIANSLKSSQTVDTARSEQRQAILMNICEYSKISQRVRFLKFAQSGKIDQVTKEIQTLRTDNENQLKAQFDDRALSIVRIRDQKLATLNEFDTKVQNDHDDLQDALQDLNSYTDSYRTCYAGVDLADQTVPDSLTQRMTKNLQDLISQEVRPTFAQSNLLKTESLLREGLSAFAPNLKSLEQKDVDRCAAMSKAYGKAVEDLLNGAKVTVKKLNASLDHQLRKDREFSNYADQEEKSLDEVKNLEKVSDILSKLNMDNSVIDRSEFDAQLSDLQRALFGRTSGMVGYLASRWSNGSSPAMAWLNFVDERQRESIGDFSIEMKSLLKDTYCHTADNGTPNAGCPGAPPVMSDEGIDGSSLAFDFLDDKSATMLSKITPELAPAGSINQKLICQRLENIWFFWSSALDHLAAEDFFCKNITDFFNASTEEALLTQCQDKVDLSGKVSVPSKIRQTEAKMVDKGFRKQATAVSAKFKELGCQVPDASVMKDTSVVVK